MTSAASLIPSLQDLCANSTHSWLCSRMTRIFFNRSSSTTTSARWTGRKGPRTKAKLHFLRFIQHCLACLPISRKKHGIAEISSRSVWGQSGVPKKSYGLMAGWTPWFLVTALFSKAALGPIPAWRMPKMPLRDCLSCFWTGYFIRVQIEDELTHCEGPGATKANGLSVADPVHEVTKVHSFCRAVFF